MATPTLLDGAMGTELIARGLDLSREPPEAWLLNRAEVVRAVHCAYVDAGAAILQTNTFGATRPRLERYGLGDDVERINRTAVALCREAAHGRPVLASLGPTGIDPTTPDAHLAIGAAYREQIAALALTPPDGLHFETLCHPREVAAGVAAARALLPSLPVIVSSTYALGDHGFQTPLGVPLALMARAVIEAAPEAIGVNCSLEARKMLGLLEQLRGFSSLPLVAQPQGGPSEAECRGAPPRGAAIDEFVRGMLALGRLGVAMLGGCCGAGPAHIAALARALTVAAADHDAAPEPREKMVHEDA